MLHEEAAARKCKREGAQQGMLSAIREVDCAQTTWSARVDSVSTSPFGQPTAVCLAPLGCHRFVEGNQLAGEVRVTQKTSANE
jgi:hypothetical protein